RNRDWHRAGGWNVAYVTDHRTLAGAEQGSAANPRRAGDGTVVLPGLEFGGHGAHFVVIGLTAEDRAVLQRDARGSRIPYNARHVVIAVIPSPLEGIQALETTRVGPLAGIELADGDPRGLDQERRDRARLLDIADRHGIAAVAGSNTHGWTSTPAAWNLLRIPGWRELTPEAVDLRIQDALRTDGRHAVRIVERWGADVPGGAIGLAATAPAMAWHVLATLTPAERLSWIAWAWGLWFAAWLVSGWSAG